MDNKKINITLNWKEIHNQLELHIEQLCQNNQVDLLTDEELVELTNLFIEANTNLKF